MSANIVDSLVLYYQIDTNKIPTYRVLSFLGVTVCFCLLPPTFWFVGSGIPTASEETERQLRTGKWEDEACWMDKWRQVTRLPGYPVTRLPGYPFVCRKGTCQSSLPGGGFEQSKPGLKLISFETPRLQEPNGWSHIVCLGWKRSLCLSRYYWLWMEQLRKWPPTGISNWAEAQLQAPSSPSIGLKLKTFELMVHFIYIPNHTYTFFRYRMDWNLLLLFISWHFQHSQEGHQTISRTMTVRRSHTGNVKVWVLGRAGHFLIVAVEIFSIDVSKSAIPQDHGHWTANTGRCRTWHLNSWNIPVEGGISCADKLWNPAFTEIPTNSSNLMDRFTFYWQHVWASGPPIVFVVEGLRQTTLLVSIAINISFIIQVILSFPSSILIHTVHSICPRRRAQPAPSSAAGKRRRDVLKVRGRCGWTWTQWTQWTVTDSGNKFDPLDVADGTKGFGNWEVVGIRPLVIWKFIVQGLLAGVPGFLVFSWSTCKTGLQQKHNLNLRTQATTKVTKLNN